MGPTHCNNLMLLRATKSDKREEQLLTHRLNWRTDRCVVTHMNGQKEKQREGDRFADALFWTEQGQTHTDMVSLDQWTSLTLTSFALPGTIHAHATSGGAWITQTVFAQLPTRHSQTLTHTYIPCTPEGVLTQTKPCKNHEKALCNSLYPHGTDAGGSSEIRCEGTLSTELLYVAARVHRTYDGTRCQIKAPDRGINHGVYDKQQLFDQIKNIRLPPTGLLYAGMHATQRGMPSLTFLSVTQPWPKEHRLKVDESLKPTRTAWQLI